MQCTNCSHTEQEGYQFCTKCGEKLESQPQQATSTFCTQCGNKRESGVRFCVNCGLQYVPVENTKAWRETAATSNTANYNQTYPDQNYASFGARVFASIIDYVIMVVFLFIFGMMFLQDSYDIDSDMRMWGFIFFLIYKVGMESSQFQGTLGKKMVGIKVTDLDGNRIGFAKSLGRYLASYLSAILLGFGYLMSLFTEKKQSLHDIMAGTLVRNK